MKRIIVEVLDLERYYTKHKKQRKAKIFGSEFKLKDLILGN